MAFTTILVRRSTTSGSIPTPGSLAIGELALNAGVGDGTLFYLESGGLNVRPIRAGSASFAVTAAYAMNGGGGGGSPIEVRDEGTVVTSTLSAINFVGAGVSASLSASVVVVTINGSSATTGSFTGSFTGAHTGSHSGSFIGSHTGSYTGSYTGAFFGTGAYATAALTAAFALTGGSGASPIVVEDENVLVTSTLIRINFTGAGVSSSLSGSTVNVFIPGGSGSSGGASGIEIRDEGTFVSSSVGVLNFLGAGVTAALSGNVVNVTIPGGSGSAGSTGSLEIRDEGVTITPSASVINFTGTGVTAQLSGSVVNVSISGGGGSGSGSLSRAVSTVTTPTIAPNQRTTGSIAGFGKSYILLTVVTDTDARIRLYGSQSYVDADLVRPIGTDPATENGVVVDLVLSGSVSLYNFTLSPVVNGANVEPIPTDLGYYTITNLSATSASISVNFNRIVLEA